MAYPRVPLTTRYVITEFRTVEESEVLVDMLMDIVAQQMDMLIKMEVAV